MAVGSAAATAAVALLASSALALGACGSSDAIRIGAVYPTTGTQAAGADELAGVETAADIINSEGGVGGRQLAVTALDAPDASRAVVDVDQLVHSGARVIFGTYSTSQAIPASREASSLGAVYVETGSLSDTLTARGLPGVYRTSVTGSALGRTAVDFTRNVVLPRAKVEPGAARIVVVFENDSYGTSVADGAIAEASTVGLPIAGTVSYSLSGPDYAALAARVASLRPTVIITGQYQIDAIPFRKALAQARVAPVAIVGASSAYTSRSTGTALGPLVTGLFAVDRSGPEIGESALLPAARTLLQQARARYRARFGRPLTPEAVTGFVGAWVMFRNVLPSVTAISQSSVSTAASKVSLPPGSEIDGSGVRFAVPTASDAGQNELAAGCVLEWMTPTSTAVVFPPAAAVAAPQLTPVG